MIKIKVLNAFAGLGGNRKFWDNCEVTAIEQNSDIAKIYKRLYANDEVITGDAMEYIKENRQSFDFIWCSPPCQSHSIMAKATRHDMAGFIDPKLWQLIIFLENWFSGSWVVENVKPYYKPLIEPKIKVGRHLFWSNKELFGIQDIKRPKGFINKSNLKAKKEMQDWLGIHFDENIYTGGNHCPVQVLRNCVHPKLGLQVFNKAKPML